MKTYNKLWIVIVCLLAGFGAFAAFDIHYDSDRAIEDAQEEVLRQEERSARERNWVREVESMWQVDHGCCQGTWDGRDDSRGSR